MDVLTRDGQHHALCERKNTTEHTWFSFAASFQQWGTLARTGCVLTLSMPWRLKGEVKREVSPQFSENMIPPTCFIIKLKFESHTLWKFVSRQRLFLISSHHCLVIIRLRSIFAYWWKIITFQSGCELNMTRCDKIQSSSHWARGQGLWKVWMTEWSLTSKRNHFP